MSRHLSADVYGYLPYWEMNSATRLPRLRRAVRHQPLLGDLDRGRDPDRTEPGGYAAINGSIGRSVIAAARAHGVRVELCFTTFGYTKNENLFGDPARQATVIAELRSLVRDLGAVG